MLMVEFLWMKSMFEFLKTSSGVVDGCAKQEELEIFEANAKGGWYGTYEALLSFPQTFPDEEILLLSLPGVLFFFRT